MRRFEPAIQARDLTPLLHARSVAIVGISQPDRFGGKVYRNLQVIGYEGKIYGVNPRYETLYNMPIYPSLSALPEIPDCVILALPNKRLSPVLEEASQLLIPAAVIHANVQGEDENGQPHQDTLSSLAQDMAICGPNCMGFISYNQNLATSGYPVIPDTPAGNITLISQSGSVWDALMQNNRKIHYNYAISVGGEMVTTVADYMLFVMEDPTTKVITLFLETIRDPKRFLFALSEAAKHDIPIAVLKVGRSERAAHMAQAHSGALLARMPHMMPFSNIIACNASGRSMR